MVQECSGDDITVIRRDKNGMRIQKSVVVEIGGMAGMSAGAEFSEERGLPGSEDLELEGAGEHLRDLYQLQPIRDSIKEAI